MNASGSWGLDLLATRTGERVQREARAVVLALGGASWPQTGSDGTWPALLGSLGVPVCPWQSANCGFEVTWDPRFLAVAEGLPIKNIAVTAGSRTVPGELLVTRYGLEGGALYQLGRTLRAMDSPTVRIDFKPGLSEEALLARLPSGKSCRSWEEIARVWRLGAAARALLEFQAPDPAMDSPTLAHGVKNFALALRGPRPVAEAISSAGGVAWSALNDDLMLTAQPGLFVAGEMIDWEAPTGGYLLQGCFATGTRAGAGAQTFLENQPR